MRERISAMDTWRRALSASTALVGTTAWRPPLRSAVRQAGRRGIGPLGRPAVVDRRPDHLAALLPLAGVLLLGMSAPSQANGGQGAGGPAGGADNPTGAGGAGINGGGSGGGSGGGAGVTGGAGGSGSTNQGGGAGGLTGANTTPNGQSPATGNGGGGGGAHGVVGTALPSSATTGGNGGNGGGDGATQSPGGGGGGGYGAVVTGQVSGTLGAAVTGGNGGNPGAPNGNSSGVAIGGSGGVGLYFSSAAAGSNVIIGANATGGTGGNGVASASTNAGGAGGIGIFGSGLTLTVAPGASVAGGGAGTSFYRALGGAGIAGSNLSVVNAGAISGGFSSDGTQADAITFTGGTNSLTLGATVGNVTTAGTLSGSLSAGGTLLIDPGTTAGHNATLSNAITNYTAPGGSVTAGSVTKVGAGTLTLTGANTYSGGTTFAGGVLNVGSAGALGTSGLLSFTGGTLQYSAANQTDYSGRFSSAGNQTFSIDTNGQTVTFANAVSSFGGSLTKLGGGTLVLSGGSNYTGPTTIVQGDLAATTNNLFASGNVTIDAGATAELRNTTGTQFVQQSTTFVGNGTLLKTGVGAVLFGNNGIVTVALSPGGLIDVEQGLLRNSNQQSNYTNNYGSLFIASGATYNGYEGVVRVDALNGSGTLAGGLDVRGSTTVGVANGSGIFSGVIEDNPEFGGGPLKFIKVGTGTETLTGANIYTGPTTVSGGILNIQNNTALGASNAGTSVAAGATLQLQGGIAVGAEPLSLAGTGAAGGSGALENVGGTNSYGGAVTLAGNTAITSDAGLLTLSGNINGATAGQTLALGGAGNGQISGAIGSNVATVTKIGTGLWNLTGTNGAASGQFTGALNVDAGILAINGVVGDTVGQTAQISVNSGGLLHGAGTFDGSVVVNSGATVSAGNSPGTLTVAGTYALNSGSTSLFELGAAGVVGGASNDLINVGGNLQLGGTLDAVSASSATTSPVSGYYRLFNYGGALSGGFASVATPTPGATVLTYTAIPGQVNLLLTNGNQSVQYWDGADTTASVAGAQGGTGTWAAGTTNWTTLPGGQINDRWRAGVGIFGGAAGTVTVAGAQNVQGLQFTTDGYNLGGAGTLNLTGDPFTTPGQSFINVDAGVGVTIANALTSTGGAVGLRKLGDGTLTLAGSSTYAGPTSVEAGTLAIAPGGSIGSDVTNTANLANAGTIVGAVSNTGTFTNSGTVTTASAPFNNAGLLVTTGVLNGGLANAGSAQIAGQLNGAVTNGGTLQVTGPIGGITTLANDGIADLGGTALTVGSLSGTAASAVLRDGQLTAGSDNTSTSYAGAIADGASVTSLTKVGAGTLTLSGVNSYSGPTSVLGGTLLVDGTLATSAVTVAGGTTLGGGGTTGPVLVSSGATIAPGASAGTVGTLSIDGGLIFRAGSIFAVDATAAGASDRLAASGPATIGGGTVQVTAGQGTYAASTQYTILTAAGGVSGRFAGVISNYAFLTPFLAYDADDVILRLARNDVAFAAVAQTRNQAATAAAVEQLGVGTPLYGAIAPLSAAGARAAFDASSGEIHASAATAGVESTRLVRDAILDRLDEAARLAAPSGDALAALSGFGGAAPALPGAAQGYAALPVQGIGVAAAPPAPAYTAWGAGFGDFGTNRGNGNAATLDRSLGGFVAGVDTRVDWGSLSAWRIGIAGGYTHDDLRIPDRAASGSFETYFGGLYAGATYGAIDLKLGALGGGTGTSTNRGVLFPGFADAEHASYDGTIAQGFGEIGYKVAVPLGFVEPLLQGAAIHIGEGGFREDGGAAALLGFGHDTDVGTTTLGVRSEAALPFGGLPLIARAFVGWRHAFGDVDPVAVEAFAAGGSAFTIAGAPIDRDALVADVGLDYRFSRAVTVGISYDGQAGRRADDNAVRGAIEVKF